MIFSLVFLSTWTISHRGHCWLVWTAWCSCSFLVEGIAMLLRRKRKVRWSWNLLMRDFWKGDRVEHVDMFDSRALLVATHYWHLLINAHRDHDHHHHHWETSSCLDAKYCTCGCACWKWMAWRFDKYRKHEEIGECDQSNFTSSTTNANVRHCEDQDEQSQNESNTINTNKCANEKYRRTITHTVTTDTRSMVSICLGKEFYWRTQWTLF